MDIGIQVDKKGDVFPSAVFIDSISAVGGIQKEFFYAQLRKIRFHSEKRLEEGKHIMMEGPF